MTLIGRYRYGEAAPRVEHEFTDAGRDLLMPICASANGPIAMATRWGGNVGFGRVKRSGLRRENSA
ncbi:hypothetical protein ACW2Q0_15550 [Nocardia sp. R16R-3T]